MLSTPARKAELLREKHENFLAFIVEEVREDLKRTLEGLSTSSATWSAGGWTPVHGPLIELEIFFSGEWLEVLGCG